MNTVLVAVLALPLLGLIPLWSVRDRPRLAASIGAVASGAGLVAAAILPIGADGPLWHRFDVGWAESIGLRLDLAVDGVSYPLVVLTALLTFLCCLYTANRPPRRDTALLVAMLLVIEVGVLGVFTAFNLVAFVVFFEVVLLPMYVVIRRFGGPDRRRASLKFALYTLLGSLMLLVGVLVVVTGTGTGDIAELTASRGGGLSPSTQLLAFTLIAVGLAIKSPLWPLHSWLPDAHTQAPTVGSVLLAGVLLKMGTYGLIRVGLGVTPDGAAQASTTLAVLAVAAIVVGGLVCLAQTDLKRLVAYSSVGHMGFVLLGIATTTRAGVAAALFGNIAHGLVTGLLFFLVGAIGDRAGTRDLARLGGLRDVAPGLSGVLGFTALASLGLPGLAGFWGEAFAVYAAASRGGPLWTTLAVVAALGAALAAAYLLRMLRLVAHGPASPTVVDAAPALTVRRADLVVWGPIVVLVVLFGTAPWLLLDGFAVAVAALAGP